MGGSKKAEKNIILHSFVISFSIMEWVRSFIHWMCLFIHWMCCRLTLRGKGGIIDLAGEKLKQLQGRVFHAVVDNNRILQYRLVIGKASAKMPFQLSSLRSVVIVEIWFVAWIEWLKVLFQAGISSAILITHGKRGSVEDAKIASSHHLVFL